MAETSTVSETNLPAFIRAGMDFFSGNTVSKSSFDAVIKERDEARGLIVTLEGANKKLASDYATASGRVVALEKTVADSESTFKTLRAQIETLDANYKTAARQAQEQIARAGASTPPNTETPKNPEQKDPALAFVDRVAAKVAGGMKKGEAVAACVREFPTEHLAWLKSGNTKPL